jgi:hypothetical protein
VRWAVENEGLKGHVLEFANNNHVMDRQEDGRYQCGTPRMQEKPLMMGSYLRRAFGKNLLIITTNSAKASAGFPRPEPLEDSIDGAPGLPQDVHRRAIGAARQGGARLALNGTSVAHQYP